MKDVYYCYGMRLRPYGIGCQPKGARLVQFMRHEYHDCIAYERPLTKEDEEHYSLDYLGMYEIEVKEND